MIRWGRGNRQGRGCCVVVPIGCLNSALVDLLLCRVAEARLV
jgi:hypothetical protein